MQNREQSLTDERARDTALLQRIAARDRDAFAQLVRRHGQRFLRFARHLTSDVGRAQDAVQEALMAIWSHTGPVPEHPRAWMLATLRHSVYRQFRGAQHSEREDVSDEPLALAAGFCDVTAQDRALRAVEDRELITLALTALSPADREALWLADAEGFTIEEQAKVQGIDEGAAKSRLHRARLRFIAALTKETPHG